MEDMLVHECIYEMCKVLSGRKNSALSDHLYNVLSITLSPVYSYAQKMKKLKGGLIRAPRAGSGQPR